MAWVAKSVAEVKVGDRVRAPNGNELVVSRIEPAFLGREGMTAFIEDTPERWFKQPLPVDATVEVLAP